MAAHDDVLDLEVLRGILDHGKRVEIRGDQNVSDITVAEDIAGLEAENCGFGAAGVCTAYPEDFGRLAFAEFLEELRLELSEVAAPFRVGFEGDFVGA